MGTGDEVSGKSSSDWHVLRVIACIVLAWGKIILQWRAAKRLPQERASDTTPPPLSYSRLGWEISPPSYLLNHFLFTAPSFFTQYHSSIDTGLCLGFCTNSNNVLVGLSGLSTGLRHCMLHCIVVYLWAKKWPQGCSCLKHSIFTFQSLCSWSEQVLLRRKCCVWFVFTPFCPLSAATRLISDRVRCNGAVMTRVDEVVRKL